MREMRQILPDVALETVAALRHEVAEYRPTTIGEDTTDVIRGAVEIALGTFLTAATEGGLSSTDLAPALDAAYALGRGEARAGRTMEALLAAYRIGARIAWQRQSEVLIRRRVSAATTATFAQLVFAYIDELSGASVAGHRDELAVSGRVREQLLDRLAAGLIAGEATEELAARAEGAGWPIPATITAVVLRAAQVASASLLLDPHTIRISNVATEYLADNHVVLLVPDAHRSRPALLAAHDGRGAIVGPTRPWVEAYVSFQRVVRLIDLMPAASAAPVDTEDHLVRLVVTADQEALRDLRVRALQPLAHLRPAVVERLTATLRSWLLHEGRRDDVAADLDVHPQTVRYRMTQIRDCFGARLGDATSTLELVVALSVPSQPSDGDEPSGHAHVRSRGLPGPASSIGPSHVARRPRAPATDP